MTAGNPDKPASDAAAGPEDGLAELREALNGLKFGNIALTIHEGRVVQIDVTEKKRLKPS